MSDLRRMIRSSGVWLGPALVILLVGLYRISTPVLWRDEVSSWSVASRSLGELFGMLRHVDASNGAYYLLLHFWTLLAGGSPVALRLPSVIAMAGAAAFAALTAQRLFRSPVAGLGAGLLLPAVPTVSRYAQEARAYALVTCATAAATWFLLRALEAPSRGRWAWYGAAMAVGAVFHLVSLIGLVGQLPLVLLHRGPRRAGRQYPLAVAVALLPAVPLILLGHEQSDRQLGWLVRPTLYKLRFFWQDLFDSHLVLYPFLGLAALALLWPGRRLAAVQLLLLAGLPVVAVWLLSQHGTSYFVDRYLLFTLPAWASLAGGGVGALYAAVRRYWTAVPVGAATAGALAAIAVPTVPGLPDQGEARGVTAHSSMDYREAARIVASDYRSGDALLAAGGKQDWAMIGPGVVYYLPAAVRPTPLFIARSAAQSYDLYPVESTAPARQIGDEPRVWVVTIGTGDDPFRNLPADQAGALRSVFAPTEVRHVRGLTVSLLVRSRR